MPRTVHRTAWLTLGGLAVFTLVWAVATVSLGLDSWLGRLEDSLLRALVELRSGPTEAVAGAFGALDERTGVVVVTAIALVALALLRRIQRILVLGGALLVALAVTTIIQAAIDEPRPLGVEILGSWAGVGGLNEGLTQLSVVLVGGLVSLVPAGRSRQIGAAVVGAVLVLVALSGGLLATDYVVGSLTSALIGAVVTLAAFWLFAPDEVYPVGRSRGRAAHLDLGGARGTAIRVAVAEQLGLEVVDITPFGLAGSAGSSPMRLELDGDEPAYVFAKLFSQQHVRSDRFYKLTRSMLYGRLEDERPFTNARRLAEFEDYTLRVFGDAGVPVVTSYGVVELTPEREYMLVTEFADGAREIGDPKSEVDDGVVEAGLLAVRRLWDGGLAHRDMKPANVLVRDDGVILIDTGFSAVRPSPWRQAVDLANMMLCLALRTDAPSVYQRAIEHFTEAELSEAFAASQGPTMPSQLRAMLKADGRDLLGELRRLAPPTRPIPIQRWSLSRVGLIAGTLVTVLLAAVVAWTLFFGIEPESVDVARCTTTTPVLLAGQAVPDAAYAPCIVAVPATWDVLDTSVTSGGLTMQVAVREPDGGTASLEVRFRATSDCPAPAAAATSGGQPGVTVQASAGAGQESQAQLFEGGCLLLSSVGSDTALADTAATVQLVPRGELDAAARELTGGWADTLTETET